MAGIQDYNQGNFTAAKAHFEIAIQTDRDLPEAHFNLGLTLHKLDLHDEARTHFRLAGKLAPKSTEIVESSIYRNHMGLSSTLERHLTGGYRY